MYHLSEKLAEKISHQWTKARQTNWKVIFIFDLWDWIPLWIPHFQHALGKKQLPPMSFYNLGTLEAIAVNKISFLLPPAIPSPVLQYVLPGGTTQLAWRRAKAQLSELIWIKDILLFPFSSPPSFGRFFIQLNHFPSASRYVVCKADKCVSVPGRNDAPSQRTHQIIKSQA